MLNYKLLVLFYLRRYYCWCVCVFNVQARAVHDGLSQIPTSNELVNFTNRIFARFLTNFTFCTVTLSVALATYVSHDQIQTVDIVFLIANVEWAALHFCSTTVIPPRPAHTVRRLKTCWLFLSAEQWLTIVDSWFLHLKYGTVFRTKWETLGTYKKHPTTYLFCQDMN